MKHVLAKHSIARRIAYYFIIMICFASLISAISFGIMWSNRTDAELINLSGSLRMQSYRLAYEMEHHPESVISRLDEYQNTLNAPTLSKLTHSYLLSDRVLARYEKLKSRWQELSHYVRADDRASYVTHLEEYAEQVNEFVFELQAFAEFKQKIAISIIIFAMLVIIAFAYFGVWYTRHRIIVHLNRLVTASNQVENERFDHIELSVNEPNELGVLSFAFTRMASELAKLYASLEEKVEDKTRRLQAVNRSLLVLYQSSTMLTSKPMSKQVLFTILQKVAENEQLDAIDIQIDGAEHWNVTIDKMSSKQAWQAHEICVKNAKLAVLRWKPSLVCADERLILNVAEMIGRSLYVMQTQKQQQQLLLMEERAIIARELHDSLAQSLTFFKIQISLMKRNMETAQDWQKQQAILQDLEKALNEAYSQLRELLSTFRLTIQEANLSRALESMLETLRPQTSARIELNCKLPSQLFTAQQQIHVLQIVREAVINAIKHSGASEIRVMAETDSEGVPKLTICDNGKGIEDDVQPEGHYGLLIMKERATVLKGEFSICQRAEGGTEVAVTLPNMMN
jgi:two-component system nitrate/nitrite sensor histidine kinase NarQ